jgi:hypothetical protein
MAKDFQEILCRLTMDKPAKNRHNIRRLAGTAPAHPVCLPNTLPRLFPPTIPAFIPRQVDNFAELC